MIFIMKMIKLKEPPLFFIILISIINIKLKIKNKKMIRGGFKGTLGSFIKDILLLLNLYLYKYNHKLHLLLL